MTEFMTFITYLIIVALAYIVGFNSGWSKCSKRIRKIVREAVGNDDNTR